MQLAISPDLQQTIVERASALGFSSPEEFLRSLLSALPLNEQCDDVTLEEFEHLLDQLADEVVPSLPADFSRADIYADHD